MYKRSLFVHWFIVTVSLLIVGGYFELDPSSVLDKAFGGMFYLMSYWVSSERVGEFFAKLLGAINKRFKSFKPWLHSKFQSLADKTRNKDEQ